FFNRTMTFAHRYFDGKLPPPGDREKVDTDQIERCRDAAEGAARCFEECRFKAALAEVMSLARAGNGYFDTTRPFATRKTDLQACGRAVNVCLQTARTLTTIMAPILPDTAEKCAAMLNLPEGWSHWSAATDELPQGHPLSEPQILIKKLDAAALFAEEASE
ncbi:MAG: class I tRNA ligase family protein, partial [Phycisphaerae bacterium]